MNAKFNEITVLGSVAPNSPPCLTPVVLERVNCGFPSPAADYVESFIDLNKYLIKNKKETFYVRANSLSMRDIGIVENDILVVDCKLEAEHEDIVVAVINNEFTLKTLIIEQHDSGRKVWLRAENPDFESIYPAENEEILIWGVVTWCLKDLYRPRKRCKQN
jgi:DNA polymerase V